MRTLSRDEREGRVGRPLGRWGDVWMALGVVAAAGALAAVFMAVGAAIARRREREAFAEDLGQMPVFEVPAPWQAGALRSDGLAVPRRPRMVIPPVTLPTQNTTFRRLVVGASAKKLLSSTSGGQLRKVYVTSDAPIRFADSTMIDADGFLGGVIPAGVRTELGVYGVNQELYAVRAGGTSANVTVETQLVGRA